MKLAAAALAASLLAGPTPPSLIHGSSGSAIFEDGHVAVARTLDRLQGAHITTYLYEIYRSRARAEWDDLPAFLDAAAARGISVLVYLFPPSESDAAYLPFGFDYPRWAAELATLSLNHPALKGFTIDDFGENPGAFPPDYARRMVRAARRHNPRFQFWPVFYYREIVGPNAAISKFDPGIIDGVIFPFRDEPVFDTSVSMTVAGQILHVRQALKPNQHLAVMVYAVYYSHQTNKGNPSPDYVGAVTQDALAIGEAGFDDGTIVFNLNLTGQDDPYSRAADYDRIRTVYGSAPPPFQLPS